MSISTGSAGERLVAFLIDGIILGLYYFVLVYALGSDLMDEFSDAIDSWNIGKILLMISFSLPIAMYDLLFEVFNKGRTPGKMALHLQVVDISGESAGMTQYLIRWIFRVIDMRGLLFIVAVLNGIIPNEGLWSLMVFFWSVPGIVAFIFVSATKSSQRLGDMVANTVVTKVKRTVTLKDTILLKTKKDYVPKYKNALKLSDKDVRLIKETLEYYSRTGDAKYIQKLSKKAREFLDIQTDERPLDFLKTLMKDYNHLALLEDGKH